MRVAPGGGCFIFDLTPDFEVMLKRAFRNRESYMKTVNIQGGESLKITTSFVFFRFTPIRTEPLESWGGPSEQKRPSGVREDVLGKPVTPYF